MATTPGWTSLAHASGADTGAPGASTGQALQSESTACVIEPDADAPTAAWHRDAGGDVQPMLQVSPSTIEGAQFWVDSRLTFHGQAIAWSTGPFDADQAATVAPAGVYAASERARWSQLGVDVHQPRLTLGPEVR